MRNLAVTPRFGLAAIPCQPNAYAALSSFSKNRFGIEMLSFGVEICGLGVEMRGIGVEMY